MWDFATEPEFQAKLDWAGEFMRTEIEPLDLLFPDQAFDEPHAALRAHVHELKQCVREQGLWACHLGPELGGQGYGAVSPALANQILAPSQGEHDLGSRPVVFGTQAPPTRSADSH